MLTELCAELRNYFLKNREADVHTGTYTISGGTLGELEFLQDGQYYRIAGSVFNDGVYRYGDRAVTLADETFTGAVWAMAVPPAVVALADEIDAWNTANAEALNSPYQSESFGGYSYSKASGGSGANGSGGYSWQDHFAGRLNKWRRLSVL